MAPAPVIAPFLLLSAFTSEPECGNPAAVVFLPFPGTSYPPAKLQAIAKNLNQPMTAFVSALSEGAAGDVATDTEVVQADFAVRWFTVEVEIPLCGHGMLAAAKAIFTAPDLADQVNAKSTSNMNGIVDRNTTGEEILLKFQTITGTIISARKTTFAQRFNTASGVEQIQVTFPHAPTNPIVPTSAAGRKIRSALGKALQKPVEEVDIAYMGHRGGAFDDYLLVELGEKERLEGREIVRDAFRESGFKINIITTAPNPSSTGDEAFISRMFAPSAGVPEDQVCGSAHCLLTPYWAQKRLDSSSAAGQPIALETPMTALQVSPRGGTLFVSWDTKEEMVKIGGEVVVWGKGEIFV